MMKLIPLIFVFIGFLSLSFSAYSQTNSAIDNMRSDTIDILDYQIKIDFTTMALETISASCKVSFESKMNGVGGISLDLLKLSVDSVQSNGNNLVYSYNDTLLRIDFNNQLNIGDQSEVTVYYHGSPQQDPSGFGGFYFQGNYAYNLGVAFLSEPHNYGRIWHPCFDNFEERATYDIEMITPEGITGYSNGYIHSESTGPNNENIRRWKLEQEIPTYLACVGAAPYTHVAQTYTSNLTNSQTPVMLIASPQDTTNMKNSFINLFNAMDAFESNFGPYEWNKIAFALVPFNGGAMEHATCIMYPKFATDGTIGYETLMAHELSHHWWGNLVTCRTAEDMWINEGLASYSESIFLEHVYGYERYIEELKGIHRSVIQKAHFEDGGFLSISGVPHDATYGSHTYSKGATLMHNLRSHMGDADFFLGLKAIQTDFAFKSIDALEFRDALTNSTSFNADNFFENYVLNPGFNAFEIDSFRSISQGVHFDVQLGIKQKLFEAPSYFENVPVQITFVGADWNIFSTTELISGENQTVNTLVPFDPVMVYLNKDDLLLNAVTGEDLIITGPTTLQLDYPYFYINVKAESDSSFLRIEHYRVAPDAIESTPANFEYVISPDRFWKVDGIISDSFKATARLEFDGRNTIGGNLDVGLINDHEGVTFHEDSLVLLWRPNKKMAWKEYEHYELVTYGNKTDGYGRVDLSNLLMGEYAYGFRKSALGTTGEILKETMKIYPNPSKENLHIEWDKAESNQFVRILDINGKIVEESDYKEGKHIVSTKSYPKGSYYVLLYQENELLAKQKFIKD
ncbi:MAG TPA: M1 family aminopeptidase [Brumimicrobium sp.]|nr:M1 family aminopeptidase [Brumimicrobium sp.]